MMKNVMNYKLLGIPVATTLIATFWLLVATWLWTGSLFNGVNFPSLPVWPELNGLTDADMANISDSWQLVGAFAILLQTIGLITLLRWRNVSTLGTAAQTGLIASVFFSIPIVIYPLVFLPAHSVTLFLINASNYMFGLVTTAMLLYALPGVRIAYQVEEV